MSRGAKPPIARIGRMLLIALLAVAPVAGLLMFAGWAMNRSAFHCLLIRTGSNTGLHIELTSDDFEVIAGSAEKLECNGPRLQPGEWIGTRHGETHPLLPHGVTYWGRFGEMQSVLLTEYRGGPSFLWVRLHLIEFVFASLLVWVAFLGRWLLKVRRSRRRIEQGLCPMCGYDLRASRERCPECGATSVRAVSSLCDQPAA
jgi:hypothetical protein